jgi:plastocyanin
MSRTPIVVRRPQQPEERAWTRAAALLMLLGALAAARVGAATLAVSVQLPNGKPLPGAVITVVPLDAAAKPSAAVHAIMDQVNLAFAPDVLVIPVGSTVEFPNTDSTSHQVYSFSPAHKFQLPLYRGKPYPPEHFDRAGLVTLGCNIHDNMLGYILVTDAPYFGTTNAAGEWSAAGIARGRYRVEIWHPRIRDEADDLRATISVDESDPARLALRLKKSLRPATLEGRPHSWDAY